MSLLRMRPTLIHAIEIDPRLRSEKFLMATYHHFQFFNFQDFPKLGVSNSRFFSAAGEIFFKNDRIQRFLYRNDIFMTLFYIFFDQIL